MAELIHVKRESTDIPFGFKIQGGSDFSVPLSILSIVPNSVADRCGLRPGDAILKINDAEVSWMDHGRAKTEIIRAGNEFYLTVERNAVDLNKPVVAKTPLSQLKSNAPVDPRTLAPPPPAPKTDLTIEKRETINIGTSHNRAPMPFNKEVGNTIDYKAAKPSNWQPGDYTKWTGGNELPAGNKPQQTVTAVFHNPYNSPIGMYSDANVLQEFQNQTKGLIPPPGMSSPAHQQQQQQAYHQQQHHQQPPAAQYHQQQPAYNQVSPSPYSSSPSNAAPLSSTIQNINYLQQIKPTANQVPRGCNSLSMNMLNLGIHDAAATNSQPPSVFDLKRGSNPTGASVPRGFRSVQAPTELPPEQRRAPTRTEYQVQHVKQNWVEPKIN